MGRIDMSDALRSAARYAAAKARQARGTTPEVEADMLNRRRNFLLPTDRVFFESIIEGSDILPIRYLDIGLRAARAVGRIEIPVDGRGTGFATGFLIAPNLLMTNQHVLRSSDWALAATATFDASDDARGLPLTPHVFRLDPLDIFVADEALDFSIVSVLPVATDGTRLSRFGYLRLFEETGKIVRDEYASIIQHPNGRQKHLAIRNNRVTVYPYDETADASQLEGNSFIYYETDTVRGSSGSPVMNDQWFVVALHRRGVPAVRTVRGQPVVLRRDNRAARPDDDDASIQYVSNEGVRVSRILARLGEIAGNADNPFQASATRALGIIRTAAGFVADGPLATPVEVATPLSAVGARSGTRRLALAPEGLEITRRALDQFPDSLGYDPDFLEGFTIPLPTPTPTLRRALAPRVDRPQEYLLPFRHFTTAMHARRRLPVFAAVNIDGARRPSGSLGQRPPWSYDPRIAEEHQPDDSIFSQMLQRGHQAAREYVIFGSAAERRQADIHSFTLTNVCPQIAAFNGSREWYRVEREVVGQAKAESARLIEFVGPILQADDPTFDSLRSKESTAAFSTRIRVPLRFWKIIAWVEGDALVHRAFILDQSDELDEAGPLELDIETPDGVLDSTIDEISELTGLRFDGL
ncbi:MAG: DNA/RNA non-specific endonuclease [Gemmatimonadaceae bacterium]|nr:DNA/RNA non-specific endonuclease [Gemmatimonadaceae bacterium]